MVLGSWEHLQLTAWIAAYLGVGIWIQCIHGYCILVDGGESPVLVWFTSIWTEGFVGPQRIRKQKIPTEKRFTTEYKNHPDFMSPCPLICTIRELLSQMVVCFLLGSHEKSV